MNPQQDVTLFERVSDALAASSPQLHSLLASLELLDREVYGALRAAAREASPGTTDDALVERAAQLASEPSDPGVRRALDAAKVFSDDPRRWRAEAAARVQSARPEFYAAAQREGSLDGHIDGIVAAGHRMLGRAEERGVPAELAHASARVAMLDALDSSAATDFSSPVRAVADAVRISSPEAHAVLGRLGILERMCRRALVGLLRTPLADADETARVKAAADEVAAMRDPSIRKMTEISEMFSDDPRQWKQDTTANLRRQSPERARMAEESAELDYFSESVAGAGRKALAQARRDGAEPKAAALQAKVAMVDALGKAIDGPKRIIARTRGFSPISFLEFDRLQTWARWGDVGIVGQWDISRVMEVIAAEPQLGRVLDHSMFDTASEDGGVLVETLRAARDFGMGRIEQALARFERAQAIEPNSLLAMCIANTQRALDRNRDALATLEAGMQRWPEDSGLRLLAAGVAFALGEVDRANGIFEPIRAGYFEQYKTNALIATRRAELDEALAKGSLYREEKSDIYDDAYAEQTWWNYWFHFNAFTRYQHAEGILGEIAPEHLVRFLKSLPKPPRVCIEVGTMCGEVLYRAARELPQTHFVGVDRNPVVKRLNDRVYDIPNLEFRADDVLNVIEDPALDLDGAVLFHVRTSPFLLPDFLRSLYANCRSKGFGAICLLEMYPPSIWEQKFVPFEKMKPVSEIRGGGLMHHNYPRILREAGWKKVDYEFVVSTLLFAGVDSSIFLGATR